ncbi:hypothetical protein TNCV_142111, partial [Trichonephila clavipes]
RSNRLSDYERVFENWLEEDIIEKVELFNEDDNEYFLLHHPVLKENSTTKAEKSVQSIFEASLVGRKNPFCPVGGLREARHKERKDARLKSEDETRLKAEEETRLKVEEEPRLKIEEKARLKAEG